jgi:hypothetical protein
LTHRDITLSNSRIRRAWLRLAACARSLSERVLDELDPAPRASGAAAQQPPLLQQLRLDRSVSELPVAAGVGRFYIKCGCFLTDRELNGGEGGIRTHVPV